MTFRSEWIPTLAVLGAVVLWGSSFPAMKTVIALFDPLTVMWARMAVAVAVLVPFWRRLDFSGYRKGDWKRLGLMALFLPCLYFLLESNALVYTTSSQAGIVAASLPLMVALGAWLMLGERMGMTAMAGLVLALGCVVWLTLAGSPQENAPDPLLGNFLELGAMLCGAGYMLSARSLSHRYSSLTLTAVQMAGGLVFFTPGLFQPLPAFSADLIPSLAALVYLGSLVSMGAFALFNYGVGRMEAGKASAFINLVPVVAVVLGWAWLGETLAGTQWIAGAGVLAGVALTQLAGRRVRA